MDKSPDAMRDEAFDGARPTDHAVVQVGQCEVDLARRELRKNGRSIRLGHKAFDILALLTATPGRVVTRRALLQAVWPNLVVEESNIQVQLSVLRKALGNDQDCIVTVPGRGYVFVPRRAISPPATGASQEPRHPALRLRRTTLFGRSHTIAQVRAALARTRVLTLTGPGGVGKTTLAMAIAHQIAQEGTTRLNLAELASMAGRDELLCAIARSCGLPAGEPVPDIAGLCSMLSDTERLLLIDNVEQIIDDVATLVEQLTLRNPRLRVLVTSRERLRVGQEAVFRVEPLEVPSAEAAESEILEHAAVQLFLARAQAQGATDLSGANLRLVGEICRRLDGIPLAIELAAARVPAFGIDGVHSRLDDRLAILTDGYRTALPRHQTLRATFDWSYRLLDSNSRKLFRRLALFSGTFTLETIFATACDGELTLAAAIDGIGDLVSKSILNVAFDGPIARYRLAESTRAYALEQSHGEGEFALLAARNAHYLASRLNGRVPLDDSEPETRETAVDVEQRLNDARNIFDWAFSEQGDRRLGVELASTMVSALLDRGLVHECGERAGLAVAAIDESPIPLVDATSEMRVRAALASAIPHLNGPVQRSVQGWRIVARLAAKTGDDAFRVRAFLGEWNAALYAGNVKAAVLVARRFRQYAQACDTRWRRTLARQVLAVTLHCRGRHRLASVHIESVLRDLDMRPDEAQAIRAAAGDPHVLCYGTLARIVWLQGNPELALEYVEKTVNLIGPGAFEPSLTHVLGVLAAPLAFLSGDMRRANHFLEIMCSQIAVHRFTTWAAYARCLVTYRDTLEGRADKPATELTAALDELIARGFRRVVTPLIVICAEALIAEGRLQEASSRLFEALHFCASGGERFFLPELWRALGVAAQVQATRHPADITGPSADLAQAQKRYQNAIDLSRAQGALMWELRASLEMARLFGVQGRIDDAIDLLEPLSHAFGPSCGAVDVRELFHLLDLLHTGRGRANDDPAWLAAMEVSIRRSTWHQQKTTSGAGAENRPGLLSYGPHAADPGRKPPV